MREAYLEEGQSLQQDALKGFYMGRHVGLCFVFKFFFIIIIALSKRGLYSSGMA